MSNARLEELRAKFQENPRRFFAPFANELRKSGDAGQAVTICRTHLSGQPGHVSGHIVLAQALQDAGEQGEAREMFGAALELDPENLIALRTMGEIAYASGEFGAARHWYERLLDADPRNTEIAQLLAVLTADATAPTSAPAPAAVPPAVPTVAPPTGSSEWAPPPRLDLGSSEPEPRESAQTVESPEPAAATFDPIELADAAADFTTEQDTVEPVSTESETDPAMATLDIDGMDPLPASASLPAIEPDADEAAPVTAGTGSPDEEWSLPPAVEESVQQASPDHAGSEPIDFAPTEAVEMAEEWTETETFVLDPAATAGFPERSSMAGDPADETAYDPTAAEASRVEQPEEFHVDSLPEGTAQLEVAESSNSDRWTPEDDERRARFAEYGFDGYVDDPVGWQQPPVAAAYSDLEAAPEDWFEEPGASVSEPVDDGPAEPMMATSEPEPVELTSAPDDDPDANDWFASSAVGEESGGGSDDFFLAPNLMAMGSPDQPASHDSSGSDEIAGHATRSDEAEPQPEGEPAGDIARAQVPPDESSEAEGADYTFEEVASAEVVAEAWQEEAEPPLEADRQTTPVGEADADRAQAQESEPAKQAWQEVEEAATPEGDEREYAPARSETPVAEPAVGFAPRASDVPEHAAAAPPPPFVTETLAELYLQQGFHDEALSIYRQLSERDPANSRYRDRIATIERAVEVSHAAAAQPVTTSHPQSRSVRAMFSGLAHRMPSAAAAQARLARSAVESRAPGSGATMGAADQPNAESPFAAAASALANLFAASKPPAADEHAASLLAGALREPVPGGRPSRAADRELSLDHLFRDVPGGSGAEVHSRGDSSGLAADSDEAERPPDEGEADIRQFTAWLEGLRKK